MGLFDFLKKKQCDICGGDIGLLGNRKLEDGNMCKDCAAKLSPWFDDRRHSTLEEIREQLAYREANREKAAAFRVSRTLGMNTKLLLDEEAGLFTVTAARELEEANPDILALTDVTGCLLDIDEEHEEIMRENDEGEEVSYDPPRYTYYYNFRIIIQVNHPYFDEMDFRLNGSRIEVEDNGVGNTGGFDVQRFLKTGNGAAAFDPTLSPEYQSYKKMGDEICRVLLEPREAAAQSEPQPEAPAAVTCPYCGASTVPDGSGCCEYCGAQVSG